MACSAIPSCTACEWLVTDVMSCKTCSAGFYLIPNTNYVKCKAAASGACGPDYWLESTEKQCVSSCFLDNASKFRSSVAGGLYKCVTACGSDEFLDNGYDRNPICAKCSSLPLSTD